MFRNTYRIVSYLAVVCSFFWAVEGFALSDDSLDTDMRYPESQSVKRQPASVVSTPDMVKPDAHPSWQSKSNTYLSPSSGQSMPQAPVENPVLLRHMYYFHPKF